MKKLIIISLLILCCVMTACSAEPVESDVIPSQSNSTTKPTDKPTQPTTNQPTTATTTTEKPTAPPTEPPTEKTTENVTESANKAYLEYITSHSEWFDSTPVDYQQVIGDNIISISDLNDDSVPELLFVRPDNESIASKIYLSIFTYEDGEMIELYDDELISIPGQGPSFAVFIGDDNILYSVSTNKFSGSVMQYEFNGNTLNATCLGEGIGDEASSPQEATYYLNGSETTSQDYFDYSNSMLNKANTYLVHNNNAINTSDISMSYDGAIGYLEDNS